MNRATVRRILKSLVPPLLLAGYHRMRAKGIRYRGHYRSWDDASAHASGYDTDLILEAVSAAVAKVQSGEVAYERDSVLFSRIEYPFELLAVLLRVALENKGVLNVLDFGGSLGSSYFQCRGFLSSVREMKWTVVEQEHFVREGQSRFASPQLRFEHSIGDVLQGGPVDVLLLASVLQYLKSSDSILKEAIASGATYIVIDRTPMSVIDDDWWCVQHVPADIYQASYPCAILSQARLVEVLSADYEMLGDFGSIGGNDAVFAGVNSLPFQYKGMVWHRRRG